MTLTPQQRANVEEALYVVWPSVPVENVANRLGSFTVGSHDETHCGTVACGGGWLARWPGFREQGLVLNECGIPIYKHNRPSSAASTFFGDYNLFKSRDNHPADEGFTGSDHACFANRLRWLLEHA